MKVEIRKSWPHSLVLIMDFENGIPPTSLTGSLVAVTPTCLAIGTISEFDGEATVILSDEEVSGKDGLISVLRGHLEIPTRKLSIVETTNQALGYILVETAASEFEVWVNDLSEPEKILIRLCPEIK